MNVNIDLLSRYQSAFGYVARKGISVLGDSVASIAQATALQEARAAWMRNWMSVNYPSIYIGDTGEDLTLYERGDASFAEMVLKNDKSGVTVRFAVSETLEALDDVLAPPPMVSFERSKNIKTTIIDNSDYEVVESFGTKQWDITFNGIIVDFKNHWYPGDLMKQVKQLFEVNDTFKITGTVFDDLDIREIYFTDLSDFSFVEGFNDTMKFKLKARSIKPAEFFF